MSKIYYINIFIVFYILCFAGFSAAGLSDDIAAKHSLPLNYVEKALNQAKIDNKVLNLINKPAEKKSWEQYKNIFVNEYRIKSGKLFYKNYAEVIKRAEEEFFVSANIIAAILGVETNYGNYSPGFNALDSLYTLTKKFDRRSEFFKNELGYLLGYARKYGLNPSEIKSSYAGAIGYPQFMPSNIKKYAVDFDNDGKIQLDKSIADAAGSIANYLKKHGWRYSEPTAVSVVYVDEGLTDKWMRVSKLKKLGVSFPFNLKSGRVKIIKIGNNFWATFPNFYTLRRYNPSNKYALSVLLLSIQID